jgi:DNA-binding transcriptional ArsR family regulator
MRKVKSTLFQDLESVAVVLRALSNSSRLRITLALLHTELSVATLEESLEIKQPNLSQQLAELRKAGILEARRSAKSVFYSIADSSVRDVIALIAENIGDVDGLNLSAPVMDAAAATLAITSVARPASSAEILGKNASRPAANAVVVAAETRSIAPVARKWQGEEAQFAKVWPSALN